MFAKHVLGFVVFHKAFLSQEPTLLSLVALLCHYPANFCSPCSSILAMLSIIQKSLVLSQELALVSLVTLLDYYLANLCSLVFAVLCYASCMPEASSSQELTLVFLDTPPPLLLPSQLP